MKKPRKLLRDFSLAAKLCAVSCVQNLCKMCAKCPYYCRMTQRIILCCPYQFKQYSGVYALYDAPSFSITLSTEKKPRNLSIVVMYFNVLCYTVMYIVIYCNIL